MQFCLSSPERKLDSSRNNVMRGKILSPHNIRMKLSIGVTLSPHHSGPCDGERGGAVRARGLCDISRLPIRRREWTQSNYCCSYCLINLSLSLSLSLFPLHTLSFSLLEQRREKQIEWQSTTQEMQNEIGSLPNDDVRETGFTHLVAVCMLKMIIFVVYSEARLNALVTPYKRLVCSSNCWGRVHLYSSLFKL